MTAATVSEQDNASLVISQEEFEKMVNGALTRSTGANFLSPAFGIEHSSEVLGTIHLTDELRNLLVGDGYKFLPRGNVIVLNKVISWFEESQTVRMVVQWSSLESDIGVILKVVCKTARYAVVLEPHTYDFVRSCMKHGVKMDSLLNILMQNWGEKKYSWGDIGMTPSMPLTMFFMRFTEVFVPRPRGAFLVRLAQMKDFSPFGPSPYRWNTEGFPYSRHDRVMQNMEERLSLQWRNQLVRFGNDHFPR